MRSEWTREGKTKTNKGGQWRRESGRLRVQDKASDKTKQKQEWLRTRNRTKSTRTRVKQSRFP
jgi:hypothetical protein